MQRYMSFRWIKYIKYNLMIQYLYILQNNQHYKIS